MLRSQPQRPREEIATWAASLRERIAVGRVTREDLDSLYRASREFFIRQLRRHRFPGAYLVKAFNLAGGGIENWFAYMLALLFLLVRPQGLFGEKIIERV